MVTRSEQSRGFQIDSPRLVANSTPEETRSISLLQMEVTWLTTSLILEMFSSICGGKTIGISAVPTHRSRPARSSRRSSNWNVGNEVSSTLHIRFASDFRKILRTRIEAFKVLSLTSRLFEAGYPYVDSHLDDDACRRLNQPAEWMGAWLRLNCAGHITPDAPFVLAGPVHTTEVNGSPSVDTAYTQIRRRVVFGTHNSLSNTQEILPPERA